jgi:hypothetical protein
MTGAISLGPSNMNGGYNFFSIIAGEILVRRKWVVLPIPNEVILKLEEFSTDNHDDIDMILRDDTEEEENIPIMEDLEVDLEDPPMELRSEDIVEAEDIVKGDLFANEIVEEENDNNIIKEEKETEMDLNENKENKESHVKKTTESRYNLRLNRELSYNHKYSFCRFMQVLTSGEKGLRKLYEIN